MIPPPGDHGGDGPALARALGLDPAEVLDLSLSLNPCAPDVAALAAAEVDALRRYPDATRATEVLAEAMGAEPGQVLLTAGGAQAIAWLAAEWPQGWVEEPDFALYRRHLVAMVPGAPRWRSNPHNPTGLLASPAEGAEVWDEAFYPLATGSWSRGDSGSVVVGSLTKLFACPGLRLGYLRSDDGDLVERLRRRAPVWPVSSLALALVPRLLAVADLPGWSAAIAGLRRDLTGVLVAAGLSPRPSDALWLLVDEAPGLRARLAPAGILVRDTASFGLPGGARIAVPDEAGLERLATALAAS